MRILAKLTSRRLTFAQEQLDVDPQHHQDIQHHAPLGFQSAPNMFQYNMNQQQQQASVQRQLWVSNILFI